MNCMRCGVEIEENSVFCEACLADMEKHPVKPGTPINLPRREKQQQGKRTKKRSHKPEDQIHRLRRLVLFLMALVLVLAMALTAAVYLLLHHQNPDDSGWLPGQNYGTSASET